MSAERTVLARVIFVVQGKDFDECLEQAHLYLQGTGVTDYSCLPTTPRPEPQAVIKESSLKCMVDHVHDLREEMGAQDERIAELTNLINADRG